MLSWSCFAASTSRHRPQCGTRTSQPPTLDETAPPLTLEGAREASAHLPPRLQAGGSGIDRSDVSQLDYSTWLRDYLLPGRPLLLTGVSKRIVTSLNPLPPSPSHAQTPALPASLCRRDSSALAREQGLGSAWRRRSERRSPRRALRRFSCAGASLASPALPPTSSAAHARPPSKHPSPPVGAGCGLLPARGRPPQPVAPQ